MKRPSSRSQVLISNILTYVLIFISWQSYYTVSNVKIYLVKHDACVVPFLSWLETPIKIQILDSFEMYRDALIIFKHKPQVEEIRMFV